MGRRRHGSSLPFALRVGLGGAPRPLGRTFLAAVFGSCPGVELAFLATAVGRISRRLAFFGGSLAITLRRFALDDVAAGRWLPRAPVRFPLVAWLFWSAVVCRFRLDPFCHMVRLPLPVSQRGGAPGGYCWERFSGP